MNNVSYIAVVLAYVFLSGCADVTSVTRNENRDVVLDSSAKAYVSIPEDGAYGDQVYSGSGRTAAGIVLGAFSTKMLHVDIADNYES